MGPVVILAYEHVMGVWRRVSYFEMVQLHLTLLHNT